VPGAQQVARQEGGKVKAEEVTGLGTVVGWFVPVLGQVMLCTIPLWRLVLRKISQRPR